MTRVCSDVRDDFSRFALRCWRLDWVLRLILFRPLCCYESALDMVDYV